MTVPPPLRLIIPKVDILLSNSYLIKKETFKIENSEGKTQLIIDTFRVICKFKPQVVILHYKYMYLDVIFLPESLDYLCFYKINNLKLLLTHAFSAAARKSICYNHIIKILAEGI